MSGVAGTSASKPASPGSAAAGRKPPVLLIVAVLVIGLISFWVYKAFFQHEDSTVLQISGRLEGYETNLSPKIGGRIDSIAVREGNAVKVGQLLAQLSDADYQAQLRGCEARILRARHQLQQKQDQLTVLQAQIYGAHQRLTQSREETSAQISQASASLAEAEARQQQAASEVAQSRAQLALSVTRLERYTSLVKKGAVTKDEYDQARTNRDSDAAAVTAKESALTAARKTVASARAALAQQNAARFTPPIRRSDVDVFQAQQSQAEHEVQAAQQDVSNAIAERDQIKANLDYLKIISPINGVVTARPVEPGAVLAPGQTVLTVLDYGQVYMRAFIPEGRLGRVRIGQPAEVFLDAMPDQPFKGSVIEIDPEGSFTPENIYFKDDRVKQVFGVKIGLEDPRGFAKPGMPADARLELK